MNTDYVSPQELHKQLAAPQPPLVIDVRDDEEYAAGHIPGARHIPGDALGQRLAEIPPNRTVVTY